MIQPCVSGVMIQPCVSGVMIQPCVSGVMIQPCVSGVMIQPCGSGLMIQPCVSGVMMQPCVSGLQCYVTQAILNFDLNSTCQWTEQQLQLEYTSWRLWTSHYSVVAIATPNIKLQIAIVTS